MKKKNLLILLSAVLALLLVVAVLISIDWNKDETDNGETTETIGETVPSTSEDIIIDVEGTEPQFIGTNTEIDSDDLSNAGNSSSGNNNTDTTKPTESAGGIENTEGVGGFGSGLSGDNVIDFDDLINLG